MTIEAVIFDMGGVLVDWDPRYVYRDLFAGDEAAMERFLAEVCSPAWNLEQDRGRPIVEATRLLCEQYPEDAELIAAFYGRWAEMLRGEIMESVNLLRELHAAGGVRLFALTNWSAETFHHARERFDWLSLFEGIVVSGEERLLKPDPAIFELIAKRYAVNAASLLFVDDIEANVEGARAAGFQAVRFVGADELRTELAVRGLLSKF